MLTPSTKSHSVLKLSEELTRGESYRVKASRFKTGGMVLVVVISN